MNPNMGRSAGRMTTAALALLLMAQSVVPRIALAQAPPAAASGMPGMEMPAAGVPAPTGAAPPAAVPGMPGMAMPAAGVAAPPAVAPPAAAAGMPGMQMPAAGVVAPAAAPAAAAPGMPGMEMPAAGVAAPPAAAALPDPAATPGWPSPVNDNALKSFLLFDLFEFQHAPNVAAARWDVVGWYGGDTERIWFKSEGRYNGLLRAGEMDVQILYGRLIFPFVDFQAGFRYEQQLSWDNGLGRPQAVIGVQGLVPYGMEVEAAIFVSQNGSLSGRATLAQDFLLTQRLILQPRFEINAALQSAAQYGVGAGVNDIELGLRLRYEIIREFAPYIGVSWLQSFGETASLLSAGGSNTSVFQVVAGFRMWF